MIPVDPLEQTVGIIGLGEVGLRLAIAFANEGYGVVGVDIDADRVQSLSEGRSYIRDIDDETVVQLRDHGFVPMMSYDGLADADLVSICVPTPLRKSGRPDVSYVVDATESLTGVLSPSDTPTVVIESTVYPGATENLIAGIFSEAGFAVGSDLYLGFSPERVDPGNESYAMTEIPKVYGGVTPESGDRIHAVYETVFDSLVRVGSATDAEMVKILENTFRNVNIALVNELAKVADDLDIDFWEVIEAAKTKPYGFMPFYPGPGLGGHCIPVDPLYLSWRAGQEGLDTPLIDLADETNREMSEYVVRRTNRYLNEAGVPLPDATVLVVGVAYKPDISDVRNSPGLDIMQLLAERGASVSYHDPHVPSVERPDGTEHDSIPLTKETLGAQDLCLIVTDHSVLNIDRIVDDSAIVFDTRNATADVDAGHVYRL